MDFSGLSNDELADATKALLDELHARAGALTDPPTRARCQRALNVMHAAADAMKALAVDAGIITPQSGGDVKP